SQTALCTGLLLVWYCGANSDSTCSSALSTAPMRRASSSVLPPRRNADSAKLWRSRSVSVVLLMRTSRTKGRTTCPCYRARESAYVFILAWKSKSNSGDSLEYVHSGNWSVTINNRRMSTVPDTVSLTDYLDAAQEAARRGAAVLEDWRRRFSVREKGRFDLV